MKSFRRVVSSWPQTVGLAVRGLRDWTGRHVLVAATGALAFGLLLGVVTVLIPNPVFGRDIPPVWWNYPVWVLTSVFAGMLVATYVRGSNTDTDGSDPAEARGDAEERRASRFGIAGGLLAWFAVGCPVCNKIALLALGYSGAITWFAPVQPFLAIGALILTSVALVWRLRGQVSCPVPAGEKEVVR
ncbi:MAG TPA: hypothetical protein VK053_06590 [Jiangellaceae bacterium]|nr:hypothetical protein [Jiangellaceae bacterium]